MSVNKVILVGNLGNDPEMKYASNGNAIANLSVATSESWTNKNTGLKEERTEWHSVSIFGKIAEVAGKHLKKGSKVYLEGQIKTDSWENDKGEKQSKTKVVISGFGSTMQMLDSKGQTYDQNQVSVDVAPTPVSAEPITPVVLDDFEDKDIPF
jgi:single-strand DNA-binding protein|tara:strand:- start:61 stop:519 length:459 start_codon:yes stop_codon:yes gene_type:complete